MNDNEKRFIDYWKNKRKEGRIKFSLKTGFIYAFFVIIFAKAMQWNFTFTKDDIAVSVIAVLIGIIILGPFVWWNRERRYRKLIAKSVEKKNKK